MSGRRGGGGGGREEFSRFACLTVAEIPQTTSLFPGRRSVVSRGGAIDGLPNGQPLLPFLLLKNVAQKGGFPISSNRNSRLARSLSTPPPPLLVSLQIPPSIISLLTLLASLPTTTFKLSKYFPVHSRKSRLFLFLSMRKGLGLGGLRFFAHASADIFTHAIHEKLFVVVAALSLLALRFPKSLPTKGF